MCSGNTCVKVANMKQHNHDGYGSGNVCQLTQLPSIEGNESTTQSGLHTALTTTIWNQHSKRQTSGKISKTVAAPRDSKLKVLPRWRFLTPRPPGLSRRSAF